MSREFISEPGSKPDDATTQYVVNLNLSINTDYDGAYNVDAVSETPSDNPHLTRINVWIYHNKDSDTSLAHSEILTSVIGFENEGIPSISVSLGGGNYNVVVWADNGGEYYDISTPTAITITGGRNGHLNTPAYAFYTKQAILVNTVGQSAPLTLKRAYNTIKFIDTNKLPAITNQVIFIGGYLPTTFDALSGKIIDAGSGWSYAGTDIINVLASSSSNISLSVDSYIGDVVYSKTDATSVPINKNYITFLYFSSAGTIEILSDKLETTLHTFNKYCDKNILVKSSDSNLIAENIKKDVSVFGVTGSYAGTDVSDTTATQGDVLSGKYFYGSDGVKTEGTMTDHTETSITLNAGTGDQYVPAGHYSDISTKLVLNSDAASKIKQGEVILGVTGTFEGGGGGIPLIRVNENIDFVLTSSIDNISIEKQ